MPLLPLYAFIVWMGKTLPSLFRISEDVIYDRLQKGILTSTNQINAVGCYADINSVV
jgi:hypothetical protein